MFDCTLLSLLGTGARLNEAMQAQCEQIDTQTGVWRPPASNSKSKKARSVPLNDSALWVSEPLWTRNEHPFLCINNSTNRPFVTITRVWYRLRAKAGIAGLTSRDMSTEYRSIGCRR